MRVRVRAGAGGRVDSAARGSKWARVRVRVRVGVRVRVIIGLGLGSGLGNCI